MYGWEIVCSKPIGSGKSPYARARYGSGTNRCRGTLRIASSTRGLLMSRARSWSSIIRWRSASQSGGGDCTPAAGRPHAAQASSTARTVTRSVVVRLADIVPSYPRASPARAITVEVK